MKLKYVIIVIVASIGTFFLNGCGNSGDVAVEYSIINKGDSVEKTLNIDEYAVEGDNILKIVTKRYTDEQLKTIVGFSGNLSELNDIYPIECIRVSDGEVEGKYKVTYIGEQCYAFLWFDENQEVFNRELYNKSPELRVFEHLGTDLSFDDIKKIDPNGNYVLFCLGVSDFKTSYHCTEDGYLVTINYDDNYKIVDIQKELI
ncbi:MAG: hypothetical protein K5662_08990 [Lachnospiraceae bacterium]|nr:hypothetical protein [Lachnospiraceae bacterium]